MISNDLKQQQFDKKGLKLIVQDTQDNLEEFMLMMARTADMGCFDILSITRTDADAQYTCSSMHPRVRTQSVRVARETAEIIPLHKRSIG